MSRKLLAVLLSELKLARVICPHCKTAIEMPCADLGQHFTDPRCPVCQKPWHGLANTEGGNKLAELARVIRTLQEATSVPTIEFVLPDDSAEK